MKTKNLRAFTLIELLVVIAIIALLAAILFPVFSRAKDRARQSNCTSNMKQIYLAYRQYAQDYDNCYPEKDAIGGSTYRYIQDPLSMPSVMNAYVKNSQIWFCPGQPEKFKEANMPGYFWLIGSQSRNPDKSEDGTNDINVLLFDNYAYKVPTPIGVIGNSSTQWASGEGKYCAHVGRTNFNYLSYDGHVKLYDKKIAQSNCKVQANP